jgi:hypothetical protein
MQYIVIIVFVSPFPNVRYQISISFCTGIHETADDEETADRGEFSPEAI